MGALAFVVVVVVVDESFPFPFLGSLVRDPVVGPRGVARVVDVNSCWNQTEPKISHCS